MGKPSIEQVMDRINQQEVETSGAGDQETFSFLTQRVLC
jgi:hypothetical protein